MKKTAAVLCAAVLTLSACGNDDDDKARENIRTAVLEEDAGLTGGTKPTEEQADCIADGMVDDVGVETLQEYELLNDELEINSDANPTDMEAEDADALAEVFVGCIDVDELFAAQFGSSGQELTEEQQQCITDAIDEQAMIDGLSASFQGEDDESFTAMQEEMMGCVTGDLGGSSQ